MIHDLDATLDALLKAELPQALLRQVTISFATPDGEFPPQSVNLPAINLFLYDLRENRELRSNEWLVERDANKAVTRRRTPTRVDCSYLITAWASKTATNPWLDEHRMLGEVMLALLRHPHLPPALLQGSLHGQQPEPPTTALQASMLQSLGEFWQALGGKPRAALSYTVTIAVSPFAPVAVGPIVRERVFDIEPKAE